MYSVKAVSQATGISPETLRAWERRYSAVTPSREANGRRSYTAGDVARLRNLKRLSDLGHPIGKIAVLDDPGLERLLEEAMESDAPGRVAGNHVEALLAAIHAFDEAACDQALALAVATMTPDRLVHDVLGPAMREIGEQWHRGEASIAQERLLSTRIRRLLISVMNAYRSAGNGPRVVFAALSGERHGIGALFAAYIASTLGARADFLDSDLPADEITRYADAVEAAAIAVTVILSPVSPDTACQLEVLGAESPPGRSVWVGGPGAAALADAGKMPAGCTFVHSLMEMESLLKALPR